MALRHSMSVEAYEAKTHFSQLLQEVEAGAAITITKHGKPVARLVPVGKRSTAAERRQAIEGIKKLSKDLRFGGLKIRNLINEGRR